MLCCAKKKVREYWEAFGHDGNGWSFTESGVMIPLSSGDVQQYSAMRNGRFLYDGGFTKQPIKSLVGAHLYGAVRSLYLEDSKEGANWGEYDDFQLDLKRMATSGDN